MNKLDFKTFEWEYKRKKLYQGNLEMLLQKLYKSNFAGLFLLMNIKR